jgi:hypothetical protein
MGSVDSGGAGLRWSSGIPFLTGSWPRLSLGLMFKAFESLLHLAYNLSYLGG